MTADILGKCLREAPNYLHDSRQQLLYRGGFYRMNQAGELGLLPWGLEICNKVLDRITTSIRHAQVQSHDFGIDLLRDDLGSYKDLPSRYRFDYAKPHPPHVSDGLLGSSTRQRRVFVTISDDPAIPYDLRKSFPNILLGSTGSMTYGAIADEQGKDSWVKCSACEYQAPQAVATRWFSKDELAATTMQKVATPDCKTIAEVATFLDHDQHHCAKAVMYYDETGAKVVLCVVPGDEEVDVDKVERIIGHRLVDANVNQIQNVGLIPGYASPIGTTSESLMVLIDSEIYYMSDVVAGANDEGYHLQAVQLSRDYPGIVSVDIVQVHEGQLCPQCRSSLSIIPSTELATITRTNFPTAIMGKSGKPVDVYVTLFDVDLQVLLTYIPEIVDDKLFIPSRYMPYPFVIVDIVKKLSDLKSPVLANLQARYHPFLDDRDLKIGVKLTEAELRGFPIIILLSDRGLLEGKVEVINRQLSQREFVTITYLDERVSELIRTVPEL